MKPELGLDVGSPSALSNTIQVTESGDLNQPESNGSGWMDHCYVPRVRPSEANGFAVYTRNKRFKSRSVDRTGCAGKIEGDSAVSVQVDEAVSLKDEFVVNGGDSVNVVEAEANLVTYGFGGEESEGEMMEIEVKEEPIIHLAVSRNDGKRRFTRSVLVDSEMENGISGNLTDTVILEADGLVSEELSLLGSTNTEKMEMKMSKKILIKGRPQTVRELFDTGLLEGYPVFYNGGKRGFPLRGTIKDAGILCSCIFCNGVRVVPPCQFEIHACKSYRRASQYICLENGKSLLDVVKECRKSSFKTLEETIQSIIGPKPVRESVICGNCSGSFLATSAANVELLCDSCMNNLNSDFDAESVKSRPLEPLLGLPASENAKVQSTPQKRGHQGRKRRKHSKLKIYTTSPGKSSLRGATRKKGHLKINKMLLKRGSASKPPGSSVITYSVSSSDPTSNGSTSSLGFLKNKTTRKILKKLSNAASLLTSSKSASPLSGHSKSSSKKITKKDQRMHKLVFENGGLPDGTEVAYYSNGKKLRAGYKMGSGIICRCCSTLISPSQFEAHAGWASRRKPYMYIYTSNGVSLHEFAVSLLKGRKCFSKENDDLCIICADGGKLVLCDGCPRAFHKECATLASIPRGNWYCTYCQNMFQREKFVEWNANAVAAGRVSGIDPIEQITNRCIRNIKNPEEAEVIACAICRGYDFSKSGFGPRTVILCDQCEKEYHVGCLKKCKLADLKELPKGKWFCSGNCKWIYSALQNLLNAGAEKLPESTLDILRKTKIDKCSDLDTDLDVRWRLLNGKIASRETRVLLSQAVAIFHDCFDPIVDSETGRDFIPSLVYGRNIRGQDFSGIHCAILTVNSTVVSAGILRIFGEEIAELPLVATRIGHQGKGYFQLLYSCIEKLLAFLNVKSFVLPATDEAKSIWTEKFGFNKIPEQQLLNYRKMCWQMIAFKGTSMLEKPVPKCRIINQDEDTPDDNPTQ